jgi:glycosyltransferase involved in cell wall biosynthesis
VSRAKRIDNVIRLFASVVRDFPEAELAIAGPAEDGTEEMLARLSVELGVEARVRILGELPLTELAELVASAHLYISAASHEGFGITSVEAMSAGVPVLVTQTGVHEQIVRTGATGWFWSGSPDQAAAQTLREALLLPEARLNEMQVAARAASAAFDWGSSTDKYERVLESAYRKSLG